MDALRAGNHSPHSAAVVVEAALRRRVGQVEVIGLADGARNLRHHQMPLTHFAPPLVHQRDLPNLTQRQLRALKRSSASPATTPGEHAVRKCGESQGKMGYGFGQKCKRIHASVLRFFLAALSRPAARSRSSSARAMAASRASSNDAVECFLSFVYPWYCLLFAPWPPRTRT
eukprot:7381993-Prymnesium_polylepis.3